jgi:asparaginyl-tRNA synthetase
MDIQEDFVKYLLNWALTKCREDLEFFDKRIQPGLIESLEKVAKADFVRISYTDAIKKLEEAAEKGAKFEFKPYWGCDIATEHERYLTEKIFGCPVMVFNYPKEIKSFYMKQNDDGKTVKAVDVLVPGIGELIGGSEREENYDKLLAACKERKMDMSNYEWTVDGETQSNTTNLLTLDTSSWKPGVYEVYLEAKDSDGNYYSYTAQIKVSQD